VQFIKSVESTLHERFCVGKGKHLGRLLRQAAIVPIDKCALRETDWIGNSEKKGVCHFLVRTCIHSKKTDILEPMMKEMQATNYPSNLTDTQWAAVEGFFKNGNKSLWSKRELVNAVIYRLKTGCQWRFLPKNFPPYATVHAFYRRADGWHMGADATSPREENTRCGGSRTRAELCHHRLAERENGVEQR
jgi:transposase